MKDKDTVSPKPDPSEFPQGWLDWDKLSLQEHIDYLKGRFAYSSEGTAKSVFELIAAYNALQSRIAELRNELSEYKEANAVLGSDNQRLYDEAKTLFERIAELESANAMFKKHLSDCSARLQKANQYLEGQGMHVRF